MNPPVLAHVIALELEDAGPGEMRGTVRRDPNTCSLDLWGDPRGCTKMGFPSRAVTAVMMRTLDPQGHRRVHWRLHLEEMPDTKINLIEYPSANLWYLTVETQHEGIRVVPLFEAGLFAFDAVSTVQTRYGVPLREVLKRGDVDEMRAEAEAVRRALAEIDEEQQKLSRIRSLDGGHVADVRAALEELEQALAKVEA
jgi:hypothetical protein